MKHIYLILFYLMTTTFAVSQTTADFENFNIKPDTFLNGKDLSRGFNSGNIFLPNFYDTSFDFWTGWSISSMRDTATAGFLNQYSSFAGKGYNGSSTYATAYAFDPVKIILNDKARGAIVNGFYISNATYTALSMRDGDAFAKKFGGASGNDPDFFYVKIRGYKKGNLEADSIIVYLADFRSNDNTQDYILKGWQYVDLKSLGEVDSLSFSMHSSDVGAFGINTPTYFCIDNFETSDGIVNTFDLKQKQITVFPNPSSDIININNENKPYTIFNQEGRKIMTSSESSLEISNFDTGLYIIKTENNGLGRFIKIKN